jgi:hypothetical protein
MSIARTRAQKLRKSRRDAVYRASQRKLGWIVGRIVGEQLARLS